MSTDHFDLAIIGTGSGNSVVTAYWEDKRVAVIESGLFGGTCLNAGCIPTKMYVHAADVAATPRDSSRLGVDLSLDAVHWAAVRDRIFGRIDAIEAGGREYRVTAPHTTAFLGRARFSGPRELTVELNDGGEHTLTADQIVIATGSTPFVPEAIRAAATNGVEYHTSDTVMRLPELPARMTIVGGGYIAAEMAHIFGSLGSEVTLLARGEHLLRHVDEDIRAIFERAAKAQWDVRYAIEVTGARTVPGGIEVDLSTGATLTTDVLLVAAGRVPATPDLHLAQVGIATHPDGRVVVDDHGQTSDPAVWALGDVCSAHQLKHVANHEARVVAHNVEAVATGRTDLRTFSSLGPVPSAVFSRPQMAQVGLTEQECREQGLRYVTKIQRYADVAYGWALEDTSGIVKLIADPATGLLLGAHLAGPQSSSLIQTLIHTIAFGQRVDEVARGQYWIHPALAEVVENALLGLDVE